MWVMRELCELDATHNKLQKQTKQEVTEISSFFLTLTSDNERSFCLRA